jgi:hypothetical protein
MGAFGAVCICWPAPMHVTDNTHST